MEQVHVIQMPSNQVIEPPTQGRTWTQIISGAKKI
jgi:hypothetical protein